MISIASAVVNAFARFERETEALMRATSGVGAAGDDAASAIVGQIEAKIELKAAVQTMHVSDEMLQELLTLQE
jgi:hypothetical protein